MVGIILNWRHLFQRDGKALNKLKGFNCKVAGDIKNVRQVVHDVICHLQHIYGAIEECTLFELKVILNELVLNAIKHGIKEDAGKHVRIAAGLTRDGSAVLMVEDEGEGYDYRCIIDKNKTAQDFINICDAKETGRGLLIVKNLCDRVRCNKKGNRIVVVKRLNKS